MYNEAEYHKLITKVSRRYKRAKINLTVENLHTHENIKLITNARNALDSYTIVFDPDHSDSVMNYPDSYYCNSYSDFKEILLFILKHQYLYVTKAKYDVMNLDYISLDELLDSLENDEDLVD